MVRVSGKSVEGRGEEDVEYQRWDLFRVVVLGAGRGGCEGGRFRDDSEASPTSKREGGPETREPGCGPGKPGGATPAA